MKCEFCGANIDIESDICPYCGMKKEQFQEHRRAMGNYARSFQQTKDTVVEQNRSFSRKAGAIAVICVLIVAILGLICCRMNMYEISRTIKQAKLMREASIHTARLDELEQAGRYEEFAQYYSEHYLHYVDDEAPYAQYQMVYSFATEYEIAVSELTRLVMSDDETYAESSAYTMEYFVESYNYLINEYQLYIIEKDDQTRYDESCYSKTHLASINAMRQNLNQLIVSCLGVSEDQIEQFENESNAHRIIMLEEGAKKDE